MDKEVKHLGVHERAQVQQLPAWYLVAVLHPRLMALINELRDCGDYDGALAVIEAMTTMYEFAHHLAPGEFEKYDTPKDIQQRRRDRNALITMLDHPPTT